MLIGIKDCECRADLLSLDVLITISFEESLGGDVFNKLWLAFICLNV